MVLAMLHRATQLTLVWHNSEDQTLQEKVECLVWRIFFNKLILCINSEREFGLITRRGENTFHETQNWAVISQHSTRSREVRGSTTTRSWRNSPEELQWPSWERAASWWRCWVRTEVCLQVSGVSGCCSWEVEVGGFEVLHYNWVWVVKVLACRKKASGVLLRNLVSEAWEDHNLVWDSFRLRKFRQCHREYFVLNWVSSLWYHR